MLLRRFIAAILSVFLAIGPSRAMSAGFRRGSGKKIVFQPGAPSGSEIQTAKLATPKTSQLSLPVSNIVVQAGAMIVGSRQTSVSNAGENSGAVTQGVASGVSGGSAVNVAQTNAHDEWLVGKELSSKGEPIATDGEPAPQVGGKPLRAVMKWMAQASRKTVRTVVSGGNVGQAWSAFWSGGGVVEEGGGLGFPAADGMAFRGFTGVTGVRSASPGKGELEDPDDYRQRRERLINAVNMAIRDRRVDRLRELAPLLEGSVADIAALDRDGEPGRRPLGFEQVDRRVWNAAFDGFSTLALFGPRNNDGLRILGEMVRARHYIPATIRAEAANRLVRLRNQTAGVHGMEERARAVGEHVEHVLAEARRAAEEQGDDMSLSLRTEWMARLRGIAEAGEIRALEILERFDPSPAIEMEIEENNGFNRARVREYMATFRYLIRHSDGRERYVAALADTARNAPQMDLRGEAADTMLRAWEDATEDWELQRAHDILGEIYDLVDGPESYRGEFQLLMAPGSGRMERFNERLEQMPVAMTYMVLKRYRNDFGVLREALDNQRLPTATRIYAYGLLVAEHEDVRVPPDLLDQRLEEFLRQDSQANMEGVGSSPMAQEEMKVFNLAVLLWLEGSGPVVNGYPLLPNTRLRRNVVRGIMNLRVARGYGGADSAYRWGSQTIERLDHDSLIMVAAHELMHNILHEQFSLHSYSDDSRGRNIHIDTIHEFLAEMLANVLAQDMGWSIPLYQDIYRYSRSVAYVRDNGYVGTQEHVAAGAQIRIIQDALGGDRNVNWGRMLGAAGAVLERRDAAREDFGLFVSEMLAEYSGNAPIHLNESPREGVPVLNEEGVAERLGVPWPRPSLARFAGTFVEGVSGFVSFPQAAGGFLGALGLIVRVIVGLPVGRAGSSPRGEDAGPRRETQEERS